MNKLAYFAAAACFVSASGVTAQPNGQTVEKVDGFVCPVITTENVLHSPKGIEIAGGHYSIAGPHDRSVPIHATNQDGTGDPMGEHAAPGDEDYTAIWNVC